MPDCAFLMFSNMRIKGEKKKGRIALGRGKCRIGKIASKFFFFLPPLLHRKPRVLNRLLAKNQDNPKASLKRRDGDLVNLTIYIRSTESLLQYAERIRMSCTE